MSIFFKCGSNQGPFNCYLASRATKTPRAPALVGIHYRVVFLRFWYAAGPEPLYIPPTLSEFTNTKSDSDSEYHFS